MRGPDGVPASINGAISPGYSHVTRTRATPEHAGALRPPAATYVPAGFSTCRHADTEWLPMRSKNTS